LIGDILAPLAKALVGPSVVEVGAELVEELLQVDGAAVTTRPTLS